jgi:hypothetical protein
VSWAMLLRPLLRSPEVVFVSHSVDQGRMGLPGFRGGRNELPPGEDTSGMGST